MMASVRGSRSTTAVPRPGCESIWIDAAESIDPGLDHVHPDAAPGDVGDALGRAHPGEAAEHELLARLHGGDALGADEAARDRGAGDALGVHAAPVVLDADPDPVALASGAHPDHGFGGLARGGAHLRWLHAVIDGVAHQVDENVVEFLEYRPIQFDILTQDIKSHLLARMVGEVTHDAREPVGDQREGHHAHGHDRVLETAHQHAQAIQVEMQLLALEVAADLLEPLARDEHLADDVDQVIEHPGVHAHRRGFLRRVAVRKPRDRARGPIDRRLARGEQCPRVRSRRDGARAALPAAEAQAPQLQFLEFGDRQQLGPELVLRSLGQQQRLDELAADTGAHFLDGRVRSENHAHLGQPAEHDEVPGTKSRRVPGNTQLAGVGDEAAADKIAHQRELLRVEGEDAATGGNQIGAAVFGCGRGRHGIDRGHRDDRSRPWRRRRLDRSGRPGFRWIPAATRRATARRGRRLPDASRPLPRSR